MTTRSPRAFALVEFIVAIVFAGVVLAPFLVFTTRVADLNSAVGQQSRREAWRSFNDQALAAGIDPSRAAALMPASNPAIPGTAALLVNRTSPVAVTGLPRIVALQASIEDPIAESRPAGAGYEIGAGTPVEPRAAPAAPLAPIVLSPPVVTPADGTVVAATTLSMAAAGEPYTMQVDASGAAGAEIVLALNRPFVSRRGVESVRQTVTSLDLLDGVSGTAWAEYAGNAAAGDAAIALDGGRTRWLVRRSDGRLQIYEPSAPVRFSYQIALGAPVVRVAAVEYAPGAVLDFDYARYAGVQEGTVEVRIAFPAATTAVFGRSWPGNAIGFNGTFAGAAAPFSGDLKPFFQPEALAAWTEAVAVAAVPVVPAGATADTGSWTFARSTTTLGLPVLTNAADGAGFFAPGEMHFTAPAGPGGTPVGRLSFDNGRNVSTGPTLTLPVLP